MEAAAQHTTASSVDALALVLGEHGVDDATIAAARVRADAVTSMSGGVPDGASGRAPRRGDRDRRARAPLVREGVEAPDAGRRPRDGDGVDGLAARAFVAAIRSPATLVLPAGRAIEVQLALLAAFAEFRGTSLWLAADSGVRTRARSSTFTLCRLSYARRARAALALGGRPDLGKRELAFASESAIALAPLVEHEQLRARALAQERMAAEAGERLSVRLGFDLHDGPLQEFAALAADLRLLRAQIDEAPADVVRARIDDALGLLGSVERHVRDLARSVDSSALVGRPFAELLQDEVSEAAAHGLAVAVTARRERRRLHAVAANRAPAGRARGALERRPPQRR